jgi:hypothetical protein
MGRAIVELGALRFAMCEELDCVAVDQPYFFKSRATLFLAAAKSTRFCSSATWSNWIRPLRVKHTNRSPTDLSIFRVIA